MACEMCRARYGKWIGTCISHPDLVVASETDKAYAAGIFDGEGCLSYYPYVGNTYLPLLEWLQDRWGGRIAQQKPQPGRKLFYVWSVRSWEAPKFLSDIAPYLKEKQKKALDRSSTGG